MGLRRPVRRHHRSFGMILIFISNGGWCLVPPALLWIRSVASMANRAATLRACRRGWGQAAGMMAMSVWVESADDRAPHLTASASGAASLGPCLRVAALKPRPSFWPRLLGSTVFFCQFAGTGSGQPRAVAQGSTGRNGVTRAAGVCRPRRCQARRRQECRGHRRPRLMLLAGAHWAPGFFVADFPGGFSHVAESAWATGRNRAFPACQGRRPCHGACRSHPN